MVYPSAGGRMVSVFPPTRYDVRPWLIAALIASLAYALLAYHTQSWYNTGYAAGQRSVVFYAVDSIPLAPDSLMCMQWRWLNE